MKRLFLILMFLTVQFSFAQTGVIPKSIQSAFEGIWIIYGKHHTNTVVIKFEQGKDHALFTDIGSGKAPPRIFQAELKGNLLVIPAQQNYNDYLEMEVIQGKLHLRIKSVQWDANGNRAETTDNSIEERIFKRTKKNQLATD